jgi:hypothetical protein
MSTEVVFEKAFLLAYRIFDIADEIHLDRVRQLTSSSMRRLELTREGSKYLQMPNPPLTLGLGTRTLRILGQDIGVDATARVFDHGAVSIIFQVPVKRGCTVVELIPQADELYDSLEVERLALAEVEALRRLLAPAIQSGHLWQENESYTVIFAEQLRGDPSPSELVKDSDLARLLLGEQLTLSERERSDVLDHHYSYSDRDLVVIDWNAAFVYEPSGSRDIPDLLEVCNSQLLELRYYDDVLDARLKEIHDKLVGSPPKWYSLVWSPYRKLTRGLSVTLLELSEFVERVENSLKIVGDFYLAKVYEASVQQLRIPAWSAAVNRKQKLLSSTYNLLKGEIDTDRSVLLEVTIVLLIVFEILMAIFKVMV